MSARRSSIVEVEVAAVQSEQRMQLANLYLAPGVVVRRRPLSENSRVGLQGLAYTV